MKSTLNLAGKLFVCAILTHLMAAVLSVSFGFLLTVPGGFPFIFILNMVLYLMFVYSNSWRKGSEDRGLVAIGKTSQYIIRGFVSGALAQIPFFILFLTLIYAWISKWNYNLVFNIYKLSNFPFLYLIKNIQVPPIYFIFLLIMPITAGIAYIFGYKQIFISEFFGYNKNNKDK